VTIKAKTRRIRAARFANATYELDSVLAQMSKSSLQFVKGKRAA